MTTNSDSNNEGRKDGGGGRRRSRPDGGSRPRQGQKQKAASSRNGSSRKKEGGRPRRRISFDDMDVEKFKRRLSSSKKDEENKGMSKDDLNLKRERSSSGKGDPRKTSSSRRLSDERKPSSSSRRLSDEKKPSRRDLGEKKDGSPPSQRQRKRSADKETSSGLHSISSDQLRGKTEKGKSRRSRRPSIDDFAVEEFQRKNRRQSNESSYSKKSKDDMDLGRGDSDEKKKEKVASPMRRRGSADMKELGKAAAQVSPEKDKGRQKKDSSSDKDKKSRPRRPIRRPSIDDFAVDEFKKNRRRQSNESGYSRKSKDDMDLGGSGHGDGDARKKFESPLKRCDLTENIKTGKSSVERTKKPRRPIRRPSIDDFAIEEYKRQNRRQSNESSSSKKSKDDMDLSGHDTKPRKEKGSSKDDSKSMPRGSSFEKFEELLKNRDQGKSHKQSESKSRRDKKGKDQGSSSPEKRRSLDASDRPKRRSLERKQSLDALPSESQRRLSGGSSSFNAGTISRRSSKDSAERPANVSKSLGIKAYMSSHGTSSRRTSRDSHDRPKGLVGKTFHREHSSSGARDYADSRRSSFDSSQAPSASKRSTHKGDDGNRSPSDDDKKDGRQIAGSFRVSEGNMIPKSLERDSLEKFDLESPSSRDSADKNRDRSASLFAPQHGRSRDEGAKSDKKSKRRHTELVKRRSKASGREHRSKSMSIKPQKEKASRMLRRLSNSFQRGQYMALDLDLEDEDRAAERDDENIRVETQPVTFNRHGSDVDLARNNSKSRRRSRDSKMRKRNSHDGSFRRRSRERSRRGTGDSSDLRRGCKSSSSHDESTEHLRTEAGEATSELDSYLTKSKGREDTKSKKSSRSKKSSSSDSGRRESQVIDSPKRSARKKSFLSRHKWKYLCCVTLLILVVVAVVVAMIVLQAFDKSVTLNIGLSDEEGDDVQTHKASEEPTASPVIVGTDSPSVKPSTTPTTPVTTMAPTPSPLQDVAIAVIVQLDSRPEETGFSLRSNSTTFISQPIGSLAGRHGEVVMDVINIPERTELVFELEDESGDGLCCSHGNGYYRVFAGTGDKKLTMVSGEHAATYSFAVGDKYAMQTGGVDPNEHCKPCADGVDCGRCAWCNADEGFLPDLVFSWQCRSEARAIPRQCYIGEKRVQYHNRYVAAMAGCSNGFEPWPRLEITTEDTICVEEARCVKTFFFTEPNCEDELSGSTMVKETCQDKIGGIPFGYDWGVMAPRERDCPASRDFATELAQRCCVDGAAYCDAFFSEFEQNIGNSLQIGSPTPKPTTYSPTSSNPPTWDGYPITVLIQLDEYPQETGLAITSKIDGENVTFLERPQGYYKKKSQLIVEKVQIPEGIEAVLTLTDKEGDGICCQNGNGYFQVYSDDGYIILDEEGEFESSTSKSFFVGDPRTLPPTVSAAPTVSTAPTFDLYPVTIAINLDRWSGETGLSIVRSMDRHVFFEWPVGSLSAQASSLFVETVRLPRDTEVDLVVTDAGGDGFCCLYGDGYIKIYAGSSAADESALLAHESAEFESKTTLSFRVGPAPSRAPANTPSPVVASPSSASIHPTFPTEDTIVMTMVLQLDKFSAETSWFVDSVDGLTNFVERPVGYYEEMKSQEVVETFRLPQGLEYRFRIVDFMGDGTCCWAGNGWYSLYEGEDIDVSKQVFYGNGDFGRERDHTFIAGKPKTLAPTVSAAPTSFPSATPTMAPSKSSQPTVTTYQIEISLKLDSHSSQTGWHIADKNGNVLIERPPGYFTGYDKMTVDEIVRLEAGAYVFTVLDSEGDGFCCKDGVGFYSLYSSGELLLFRQGTFEYSYSENFEAGAPTSGASAVVTSSREGPMLRGSVQSSYEPKRLREHEEQ